MVRKLSLLLATTLVIAACGGGEAAGPDPDPTLPTTVMFTGQPPTPDFGPPGPGLDPVWILGPAYVHTVDFTLLGEGRARFTLTGELPTPCHHVRSELLSPGSEFFLDLEVWSRADAEAVCAQVLTPFEDAVEVAGLREGAYSVRNGGKQFMTVHVPAAMAAHDCDDEVPPIDPFEGIFPATDWSEYERIAGEVAAGHQPFLLDPVEAAAAYLRQVYGEAPGDLTFTALEGAAGEVVWPGGRVVLWRYAEDGPWMVTGLESAAADVSISDYSGGVVYVGVVPHQAGRVLVRAGAFASEWAAEFQEDAVVGETIEGELRLGTDENPGPGRILVEVRVIADDGQESIARFGVNLTNIVYDD